MATTALVAEILIVGLEGEAVLGLLVLALFGDEWVRLDALEPWTTVILVIVLASAYVIGVVVDRLADSLIGSVGGLWSDRRRAELGWPKEAEKRLRVLAAGGSLAAFLEYQRSRLRVARGTLLMTIVALPAATGYLVPSSVPFWDAVLVLVLLGALSLASAFAAVRIHHAYVKRLDDAYKLVEKLEAVRR